MFFIQERGTMKKILSIDIGGTSIKFAVMQGGELLSKPNAIPIRGKEKQGAIDVLVDICSENKDVDGIAIAAPGAIINDSFIGGRNGIPNFWNFDLVEELNKHGIDKKILVLNDANAAMFAEYYQGAGKGKSNIAMITVGTGIGGGLIINDQLITGKNGLAGEFGYLSTYSRELGKTNFEWGSDSAGFKAFEEKYEAEHGVKRSGKEIFERFENGEPIDVKAVEYLLGGIANVLWNITFAFNPELIIIGGGLSNNPKALEYVNGAFTKLLKEHGAYQDDLFELAYPQFSNDAGIIGAYAFYVKKEGK